MNNHHFLLLSLPAQGHINPVLQLAQRLTRAGARVTFATTIHGLRQIRTLPTYPGLSYASFSNGNDDGTKSSDDGTMAKLKRVGSETLTNLRHTLSDDNRPVTFLIYTLLLPWAAEVARGMHVPSAFLCIHSATSFAIYQQFFNRHDGLYHHDNNKINPSMSLELPDLPLFTYDELPSFLLPTNPYSSAMIPSFQEHIQTLEKDPNPYILFNTFHPLEEQSIKTIDNMNVIPIGPLIPSNKSYDCDLFESSGDYLQWLDTKPERSVVYVSFGTFVVLTKRHVEEMLQGLIGSGRPFLWVVRSPESEEVKGLIDCDLGEEGLIVPWCSQVEVLSHRSVGCFATHCGWNSTVESVVAGVAVVACPQMAEQMANAKMVEEVWRTGVRAVMNGEGVVEREEIRRCLDVVMGGGERGEEIRRNCMKWKGLAMEAMMEGGSSYNNLKQFLDGL